MTWIIYLIVVHLLALPGLYFVLALVYTALMSSTTNILTGEAKPWARGLGWGFIGAASVALLWLATRVYSRPAVESKPEIIQASVEDDRPVLRMAVPSKNGNSSISCEPPE